MPSRTPRSRGLTLIELMIVVVLIAILAAIAIPNLLAARLSANETSAISTLRNVTSCQTQFQSGARADVDGDGSGEFGVFRELSGARPVRAAADGTGGVSVLSPPLLSASFRTLNANGEVTRPGYLFRMFLPDASGAGVSEPQGSGPFSGSVDADLAETAFCCYAWPAAYGNSGRRTFFMNQRGDLTVAEVPGYTASGAFTDATVGRAFLSPGAVTTMTGQPAIGTVGRDGEFWKQIN